MDLHVCAGLFLCLFKRVSVFVFVDMCELRVVHIAATAQGHISQRRMTTLLLIIRELL